MKYLVILLIAGFLLWPSQSEGSHVKSAALSQDKVIPQREYFGQSTQVLAVTIDLEHSARVFVFASLRWLALDNPRTVGDRVAGLKIDGSYQGPLIVTDSCANCLWQLSDALSYSVDLTGGTHVIELVAGGCCGIYGRDFLIGTGSRLDVLVVH